MHWWHQDVAELIKIYKVSGQGTKDKHLDTGSLTQATNREVTFCIPAWFICQPTKSELSLIILMSCTACFFWMLLRNGRSALHYTCQHGALKATRVLLAAGSNPWLEDDHGATWPWDMGRCGSVEICWFQTDIWNIREDDGLHVDVGEIAIQSFFHLRTRSRMWTKMAEWCMKVWFGARVEPRCTKLYRVVS